MPTYEVEIPGQGKFRVESDTELNDQEAYQAAIGHASGNLDKLPEFATTGGYFENKLGGMDQPDNNAAQQWLGITGRRVGSALDAASDIPFSLKDVITGGDQGRLSAALRLLQGVTSPISTILAPVEAVGEEAARGAGLGKFGSQLTGDITGLAGTFGLGALSKAGKLGPAAEDIAKFIGVGRPKTFEEAVARDPQLLFVAEREPSNVGVRNLELAARGGDSIEQLALDLGSPEMARVSLGQKASDNLLWQEAAKANNIISDIPPEPILDTGKILFDGSKKDINILDSLGTMATRANAIDRRAGAIAYETQLTELGMNRAIENRTGRVVQAMEGLSDAEARSAVLTRSLMDAKELAEAPESAVTQPVKDFAQFLNDKFEVDRNIAIPRMRDKIRDKIAAAVRKEMGDSATEAEMVNEINRRVVKAVPDNMGVDQAVLQMFPGFYKVMDKNGNILRTADTGLGWKQEVYDLVHNVGMDAKELKVEAQAYLDSDLLSAYKGRTKRALNHLADGLSPTDKEILAAGNGEYSLQKGWNLFNSLKGESGNPKGYADDLKAMLSTYDRSFERWMQVNDLNERIAPTLKEVAKRYPKLAEDLKGNIAALWGHRMPGSAYLDNTIASIPLLRDITSPLVMERWANNGKKFLVDALLRFNPRFQAVNATQTLATLWPIADASEIMQGIKLRATEAGKELMSRHGVTGSGSKIEGLRKSLGPSEAFNQEVAWMTMYNRARKFGLSDAQAADYGKLRGQVYSQFLGLTTDQPIAFRKIDPSGLFTMFQRFPVKQAEMVIDLIKDRNFPGAAKWLGVNLALGGMKAATLGQAGWLSYKVYKDMEAKYGKGFADVVHTGLPALLGSDISSSVQAFNPPFGEGWGAKFGNFAAGPLLGLAGSTIGAAFDNAAVDPSVSSRVMRSIFSRNPGTKLLWQLFGETDKYDFRDTGGRLRWKADAKDMIAGLLNKDLLKTGLGIKPAGGQMGNYNVNDPHQMKAAEIDTFVDALMDMNSRRSDVLDYAASRYGQARAAGVDLGKDLQDAVTREVDKWNNLWPEFPITFNDIMDRAKRRAKSAMEGTAQRAMDSMPNVIKKSQAFQPTAISQPSVMGGLEEPPLPPTGLPHEFFGGG